MVIKIYFANPPLKKKEENRVPASQHPEIAPTEFEDYVDAHELMVRKKSLKRRQSVLSVYFTASDPKEIKEEEAKHKKMLRRSVSMQLPNVNGKIYMNFIICNSKKKTLL